jgi:phosphate transport system protein
MAVVHTEDIGHRHVLRAPLDEALRKVEERALAGLPALREALRAAVLSVTEHDAARGDRVISQAHDLHCRYDDVHQQLVSLMARQAPVAGDLRLAIALLHVNDRLERMSAQCVNIVTLCRALPEECSPSPRQLECLEGMASLADEQLTEAERVFAERDEVGARRLSQHDLGINERNRRCFDLAIDDGVREAEREVAFMIAMMARAIERIGDNAVDIGRQVRFVVTGQLERSSVPAG